MMETQTARCRVDDIAGSVLPTGNLFFVWVTLNEQKWISFAERRGRAGRMFAVKCGKRTLMPVS